MIQLNLKRNDVQGLKMQSSMPQEEQEKETPVFTIPEITLEGECETIYTVQKERRAIDFQRHQGRSTSTKCIRTADVSYGYQPNPAQTSPFCLNCLRQQQNQRDAQIVESVRYTHCQLECQPNKPNDDNDLERSTVARYELAGKREKYAIQRAYMLSAITSSRPKTRKVKTLLLKSSLSRN
ncbi:hypothetical protein M3Y95_01162500 [Aphelenchoides besseyi]|nr:hypothetical protein M3Y95_01162500 [Aphelenchoides besseyi]